MDKKTTILLTILGIATFLMAMVGTTFAYFTATVKGNDTATVTTISAATIGATFSDSADISISNIVPGWNASKTITIENTSTTTLQYNIKWTSVNNTFVKGVNNGNSDDFVYTLTKTSTNGAANIAETAVPSADGNLITKQSIAAGETQTYTLTILFKSTGVVQDENQGASFSAKLQATIEDIKQP
jgi:hypothetical protein